MLSKLGTSLYFYLGLGPANIGGIIQMHYSDNLDSDKIAKLTVCIFIFENNLYN